MSQYIVKIFPSVNGGNESVFSLSSRGTSSSYCTVATSLRQRIANYQKPDIDKVVSARLVGSVMITGSDRLTSSTYKIDKLPATMVYAPNVSSQILKGDWTGTKYVNYSQEMTREMYRKWSGWLELEAAADGGSFLSSSFYVSPSIPESMIGNGGIVATVASHPGNIVLEVTMDHYDSIVTNLTTIGEFWEKPISVSWRGEHQEGYEYELYYNNVKIKDGSGGVAQGFDIPANTFTGTLPASVRVRSYNTRPDGVVVYSNWIEKQISLKNIEATISNLIVTGEYWEDDISFTWQSTDQQQFKIEAWKDNILVKTFTGTTATNYKVVKNTLTAGVYLFKVWVGYANRFVNNQSKNVTLKNILPTVSNVSLSGSNVDYSLTLSWLSTYQSKAELEIYKGNIKLSTIPFTTETLYVIVNNTLESGTYSFKVRVAYTSATGDRWSDFSQLNITLVETQPSIGALQPDGTIRDKDSDVDVWWTSQNQTKYNLKVGSYTYSGSTEKLHTVPAGTFADTGDCIIELEVIYVTPNAVEKPITKTAMFKLTGKPSMPTITSSNSFTYNRPVVTWDSVGQQGFVCTIEDLDGVLMWSSDWQNGLINRIKCMTYLPNGDYVVKVQIMNNTLEKSDIATQRISVNSTEVVDINLTVLDVKFGKKLTWDNENDYYEAFYIMRNGLPIAKTNLLEYFDYESKHGESEYIVRGVTAVDTYKDSNAIISILNLPHATLATLDLPEDCIDSELQRDNHNTNVAHGINSTVIYLNGREYPVVVVGEHITEEYAINFVSKDYPKFIEMCDRRETFIYRNRFGTVSYLSVTDPRLSIDRVGGIYTATGLRVDYEEVIEYD